MLENHCRRYAPLLVWILVVMTLILIPLKIIGLGYLPTDDALRHAAKAVSGKPWSEILVVRPELDFDHNYGWHTILGAVYRLSGWSTEGLVIFATVALFLVATLPTLGLFRRPEAFITVLLLGVVVLPPDMLRLFLGRPLVFSVAALLVILWWWRQPEELPPSRAMLAGTVVLIALSVFIHGSWYLWVLPLGAMAVAGQFWAAVRLGGCWVAGTLLGSLLTGSPWVFLKTSFLMAHGAVDKDLPMRFLVAEFRPIPATNSVLLMLVATVLLLLGRSDGRFHSRRIFNPVFVLAVLGWVLGLKVGRFWYDWGFPACLLWLAWEFQDLYEKYVSADGLRRLGLVAVLCAAAFNAFTSDLNSRWTTHLDRQFLNTKDPALQEWLPGKGGIVYSTDMRVFYNTFFQNPSAPWRYVLGYEPVLMPKEDLEIFRQLQTKNGAGSVWERWLKKMRPEDRIMLQTESVPGTPLMPGMEWKSAGGMWIGRRTSAPITTPSPAPASAPPASP